MRESAKNGLESHNRALTQHESELVRWLIEHSHRDANYLLSQIDHLAVAERCTCGCPTIYFALHGAAVPRKGEQIISDWIAAVDDMEVSVTLFETNEKISSLEVTSLPGSEAPFGLPSIESIRGS